MFDGQKTGFSEAKITSEHATLVSRVATVRHETSATSSVAVLEMTFLTIVSAMESFPKRLSRL